MRFMPSLSLRKPVEGHGFAVLGFGVYGLLFYLYAEGVNIGIFAVRRRHLKIVRGSFAVRDFCIPAYAFLQFGRVPAELLRLALRI